MTGVIAQAAASASASILLLSLLFIFLTAVISAVATKWARDKCLKFFAGYHVTLERVRGQTIWGRFKVFSSGVEVVYDHPYVDGHGQKEDQLPHLSAGTGPAVAQRAALPR